MPRFYFDAVPAGGLAAYDAPYAYVGPPDLQGIAEVSKKFESDGKKYWVVHQSLDIHGFGDHAMYTGCNKAIVTEHGFEAGSAIGFHRWFRHRVAAVKMDGIFVMPYRFVGPDPVWGKLVMAGLLFLPETAAENFGKWHYEGSAKHAATLAWMATRSLTRKCCDRKHFLFQTDYQAMRRRMRSIMCSTRNGAGNRASPSS